MSSELGQIKAAIAGLESQRALLGDAVADAALAPLRARAAALALEPSAPDQTLKQVTILFLDVVGSTELSQHLDPEDIQAVLDGALARWTEIVEVHGGKVLQYAGDSLLAVFGAGQSREDDAKQAVLAGLALLAEGRLQEAHVRTRYGRSGFGVRVGINTGDALLGGGVDAEGSVRGIAVNIAARMEQTAPAGGLRVSHDTYRHVRGLFDLETQQPIAVKGLIDPVITYLVLRAKPRAFRVATRGVEGIETDMVGREAELEQLKDAFRRIYTRGEMSVVTIVAEAGLGKSRLLYEFDDWTRTQPEAFQTFWGRANPQTQNQPYGLLRDILSWQFMIADSDSTETAKHKIEEGIAPLFEREHGQSIAQGHAHLLGHLIGLDFSDSIYIKGIADDGEQIRERGFHAAAQMFRRIAAKNVRPVVLLLDDLHWADDGTLDFLNYLAQVNRDVPTLLVELTRPELFERKGDWNNTEGLRQRIDLQPLDRSASRLLAHELLKKLEVIPSSLSELISSSAEGNPFYMEELVKMLVDQGGIERGVDRWSLNPAKLRAARIPQTLTGVLQARLDTLRSDEKLALQQASVIGLVFWDQALSAIASRAIESLPAMTQRELVVPHPDTSLEGTLEYAFKHQILQRVTYETVIKRLRREYHARVAAWLASLTGTRAGDFLGVAAEHFDKAGDSSNACEFFARAAEHAASRYGHAATLRHVAAGLALAGNNTDPGKALLHWRLLDVRERTLDALGRRSEQQADIDSLQRLAEDMDDDNKRGEVARRHSDLLFRTADYPASERAARLAMSTAEQAGNVELSLLAQHLLAVALHQLGEVEEGKTLALKGLASAREQGLRSIEGRFLNTLSFMASVEGDHIAFMELSGRAVLIARTLGDRQSEAKALGNLGTAWLGLGQHAQARPCLEEALQLARAMGFRQSEIHTLVMLSQLAFWSGDNELALTQIGTALEAAIAVQDSFNAVIALLFLGAAELATGRYAEATVAYERSRVMAHAIGHVLLAETEAGLALVALAQGDVARAMMFVEGLLDERAVGNAQRDRISKSIRLACHQVLARAGDPRAIQQLARAHSELLAQAASIADAGLRDSFLNNVPEHREIVVAWETNRGDSVGER